jgi:hypothetical protein
MTLWRYLRLRLARLRSARGWLALGLVLVFLLGTFLYNAGASQALLTLVPYGIAPSGVFVTRALWGQSAAREGLALTAFGYSRFRVARTQLVSVMAVCAGLSALMAAFVLVCGHVPKDPSLLSDLPLTVGISVLGGLAYGAYFGAAQSLGRFMPIVFLILDAAFARVAGLGLLFPRGHLVSLLGGEPALVSTQMTAFATDRVLSERASSVWLTVLTLVFATLSLWRTARASESARLRLV